MPSWGPIVPDARDGFNQNRGQGPCSIRARTKANALGSDGTVWFGDYTSPGGRLTLDSARGAGRPVLLVYGGVTKPSDARAWIEAEGVRVLNVAGNRESTAPGIGEKVERFLARVFRPGQGGA